MFNHAAAIGADIGRYLIRVAVIKIDGEILAARNYPLQPVQSRDYIINMLITAIRELRQEVAADGINPISIGISAKGFVDHRTGTILGPDQGISDWTEVPLARILKGETGLPVYVDNDAKMMTLAEYRFGSARGFNDVVFISLRTGIGGGIIINGRLYRGAANAGGEIGQMIISHEGGTSDKGITGSFEHLASAAAVLRRFNELAGPENVKNGKALSCKEIFELSYEGVEPAATVICENARLVGTGLANLIAIFAPEIIVLGGGMAEAHDSYISMIRESAFANSLENCRTGLRIERALLGSSGSLLGSAYWSMKSLAGQNI